ncbi:MAG: MnhB domain-containing protein [Candidatus Brocadiaceae bacterium]|jgi:multicomponent Na+:H+ antiporter subunit B
MKGMTLIVKTITALLISFILLFGFYVILTGHLSPGGGFAGGVVCAAGLLLVVLAFGADAVKERMGHNLAVLWESLGAIGFLGVALLGFITGTFFAQFLQPSLEFKLFTGGSMPVSNLAIGLKVGAGLFGAFLMLAAFREHERADQEEQGEK